MIASFPLVTLSAAISLFISATSSGETCEIMSAAESGTGTCFEVNWIFDCCPPSVIEIL